MSVGFGHDSSAFAHTPASVELHRNRPAAGLHLDGRDLALVAARNRHLVGAQKGPSFEGASRVGLARHVAPKLAQHQVAVSNTGWLDGPVSTVERRILLPVRAVPEAPHHDASDCRVAE